MNKEVAAIQEKFQECQFSIYKEEGYAVFVIEDWRTPPHGIPDLRDPTSQQDTSTSAQKTCGQVLLTEWDPIQKRVQWRSLKMPETKKSQRSSQGGPFR